MVTYIAVGFVLLEAVWLLVPMLGLVEDVSRIATGIVVLGFPFAVVLAWAYDLTPEGIVRTPDDPLYEPPEGRSTLIRRSAWLLFCLLAVLVGFILRSLRM